jgi:hypothetical protein
VNISANGPLIAQKSYIPGTGAAITTLKADAKAKSWIAEDFMMMGPFDYVDVKVKIKSE